MSLLKIKLGADAPEHINVVVEIPQGSHNKYEIDEKLGVIRLDRVLHSPLFFPFEYGFVPETRAEDGDHLDILIVNDSPLFVGCLAEVRPIGVLKMSDEQGVDDKIIGVLVTNPHFREMTQIDDVQPHILREIAHFFEQYKGLEEKKFVKVAGFGSRAEAHAAIVKAHKKYRAEHRKKR